MNTPRIPDWTGHDAEMEYRRYEAEQPLPPTENYRLRIRRDNSPAELAHPLLQLGWQADGSLVIVASVITDDRSATQHRLLSTVYRFERHELLDWLPVNTDFRFDFVNLEIGLGHIIRLGVTE